MSQALDDARPEPATGASASVRALVAAVVGNVVEWYDLAVFGAFATVLAVTYFPGTDPGAGCWRPSGCSPPHSCSARSAPSCSAAAATAAAAATCSPVIVLMSLATAGMG